MFSVCATFRRLKVYEGYNWNLTRKRCNGFKVIVLFFSATDLRMTQVTCASIRCNGYATDTRASRVIFCQFMQVLKRHCAEWSCIMYCSVQEACTCRRKNLRKNDIKFLAQVSIDLSKLLISQTLTWSPSHHRSSSVGGNAYLWADVDDEGKQPRVLTMASTVAHLLSRLDYCLSAAGPAISPRDLLVHWWM